MPGCGCWRAASWPGWRPVTPSRARSLARPTPMRGWFGRTGPYQVDAKASRVEWVGRGKNLGRHYGQVGFGGGEIVISQGVLESASLEIDLRSLENHDLGDESLRGILLAHLSSRDFFWVEKHPKAIFRLSDAPPMARARPGQVNFRLKGEFTPARRDPGAGVPGGYRQSG